MLSLYYLVANGPITDNGFQTELTFAIREGNLGGRVSTGWTAMVHFFAGRIRSSNAFDDHDEITGTAHTKRRRRSNKTCASIAALVGIRSRLLAILFRAVSRMQCTSAQTQDSLDKAVDAWTDGSLITSDSSEGDNPRHTKRDKKVAKSKRKSVPRWACDIITAGRLRIIRAAALLRPTIVPARYENGVCELSDSTSSSVQPELRFEVVRISLRICACELTCYRFNACCSRALRLR